ncbi:anaerobic sulfite reductase subunit B [Clostridium aceticum]|uniref:Anaerobic sulfite reductase subunit B n=1 Tax=Clostridium aceticum TaxID=84022 RepID=A0A0D8IEI0_9CLOT|nr:anaerobic sulfite reductase subunit AsrB [Clostridium aceticum]AKL93928.1 anaerobic sulfite reductase subunit B [Clostridium aceticum]KJF28683.1 sulfite reductase [Clostridium aceticum]
MHNAMIPEPYKILSIINETKAEHTFRVACDAETKHGQFFMLSIPKVGEAPISVSGKGPGFVEFTIRKVGKLTEGVFGLNPGNTLFMRGPYGNSFPVEKYENKDLVIITGGTGLAPVKTLINHFYDHPEVCKSVNLIAGFKDIDSVLFEEEIEKFKSKFNVICTLDDSTAPGFERGLVTAHIDKIPFNTFKDYNVVVVGPEIMMHFATKALLANGVDESQIWVSIERKMSCAVGKCGHCKINETYVCTDGPVFNYTKAKDLVD